MAVSGSMDYIPSHRSAAIWRSSIWLPSFLAILSVSLMTPTEAQDLFYFNVKPQNQDVVEGTETRLYCDVSDRRHIMFQWTQNGKPMVNTTRKYQEDSNLRIMRVLRGMDEGPFQCVATNATTGFSMQSQEASLNIQWIDKSASVILKRPKKDGISVGMNITLRCQVNGNPQPTILWFNNKYRLFTNSKFKILDGGTRLKAINISATNNGIISCHAENMAGAVDSQDNFLLNVPAQGFPRLLKDQFTPYILSMKNGDARLDCPFEGAYRIDWFSHYEKLSNGSRHIVYPNGSLYFPKVRASDEGSYQCEGLSRDSPSQTFTSELVLSGLDDITPQTFEPRLLPNYPIVIPVQQRFEIKVFPPGGQPPPDYRWMDRNDRVIGNSGRVHVQGNNLVFDPAQEMDTGNYTFVINNTADAKKQNVWIMVSVPPIISRVPQSTRVAEDGRVLLSCQVAGTPYPVTTVLWRKDDVMIPLGSKHHQQNLKEGTLIIPKVLSTDEGKYACVANTTGHSVTVSTPAYLTVIRKLKFHPTPDPVYYLELDKEAIIQCKAEALTPPIITWSKLNEDMGRLPPYMTVKRGVLYIDKVRRQDEGPYQCEAIHRKQGQITVNVMFKIVEKPSFSIKPSNSTVAYEAQPMMLHCVALGDPKPIVTWDKDGHILARTSYKGPTKTERYTVFPNGTLLFFKILHEDKGRYGCSANNSAGKIRTEFNLRITQPVEEDDNFDMVKTVIIAVCSAGAYLALVIGLTAYCSYRLLSQRKSRKQLINPKDSKIAATEFNHHREQHELLMKDRDSGLQCRSDSDNRSHASGLSSHPSHSSASASASASAPPSHLSAAGAARVRAVGADKFQFPRQELRTLGIIGKGQFGDVFLAKARAIRSLEPETLVVVKSLLIKEETVSGEFHKEIEIYGKMEHPNIVRLLGVCMEAEPNFMITEYCDWGDLKQFLLATRTDNGRRIMVQRVPTLTSLQKVKMCQQVALAMEYMSSYKFIHKDLAARNVLLTSRLDLKICNLSLCRDVYANEYYPIPSHKALVPLRWLPPEAVRDTEYSFQTDIWSYGVLLWEVFHLADLPYRLHSDDDVFNSLCSANASSSPTPLRLDFAENCPSQLMDIVLQCCVTTPTKRPTFSDLVVTLGHLLTDADCV